MTPPDEAPAPEGLRAALDRHQPAIRGNDDRPDIECECGDQRGAETFTDHLVRVLAAPPSPAEPPRPDERAEQIERAKQKAAMYGNPAENRAEARPPEGCNCGADYGARTCPAHFPVAEARPPEGLAEAWASAEAALPQGSHLCDLIHDRQGWTISAWPDDHSNDLPPVSYGPAETPAAALSALAVRLPARGAEPR